MSEDRTHGARTAFITVTCLFFAWGAVTSNNDPLIAALRAIYSLSYTEALLTQFAALPYLSGRIADAAGLETAFIVPAVSYLGIVFFAAAAARRRIDIVREEMAVSPH
jgi:fucose permease